jgi:hypothetical protein
VQPALPYTINRNVSCPFSENACNGTAISLDTGRLRSDTHLGVNTRPEDALSVRKVLTCVPLAGEKYATDWQQIIPDIAFSTGLPLDTKVKSYAFGPRSISLGAHVGGLNYTAAMDEIRWRKGVQPYSLQSVHTFFLLLPFDAPASHRIDCHLHTSPLMSVSCPLSSFLPTWSLENHADTS